jgi:hypothetical protein
MEESGGKWVMEHLYKRRRNAAVQTNPVPKPLSNNFSFVKSFFAELYP